ncbi:MAG TPA: hypothetical protein DCY07_00315 [Rhodospirillaceae bacterium]|nr:hypothetical protein [Rhodospirillaceae bacterium]
MKIGGYEVRLFGIVPPQMSASNGPQARAVVDALATGTVSCRIKDRDREGRLLALCSNEARADFGMELLRRGLAVSARGSLQSSDYAAPYLAAEQAAQDQKLGIWAGRLPAAATEKSIQEASLKAAAAKAELARLKDEEAKTKAEIDAHTKAVKEVEANNVSPTAEDVHAAALMLGQQKAEAADTVATLAPEKPEDINMSGALDPAPADEAEVALQDAPPALVPAPSFVERFQLLITGILFLMATLSVVAGVILYRLNQKREDMSSVAAALRGELMAARSICQARLAKIAQEENERTTSWPRLRTIVFQAYVGRLGQLGADLSRQIASIYGQASDYASYYNTGDERSEGASKRQALESLVHHIEEVTPRLSLIEKNGSLNNRPRGFLSQTLLPRAVSQLALRAPKALSLEKTTAPKSTMPAPNAGNGSGNGTGNGSSGTGNGTGNGGPGTPSALPQAAKAAAQRKAMSANMAANLSRAKSEVMAAEDAAEAAAPVKQAAPAQKKPEARLVEEELAEDNRAEDNGENTEQAAKQPAQKQAAQQAAQPAAQQAAPQKSAQQANQQSGQHQQAQKKQRPPLASRAIVKEARNKQAGLVNFTAPIFDKLSKLKDMASLPTPHQTHFDPLDFTIPDYANLTEEELEALLYAEEEMISASPVGKSRQTG